eukprot:2778540-Ditylum_brightwellii.AAC.1
MPNLKGFIFNAGHMMQVNMYVHTSREIAQYAGCTCKMPDNIKRAIENLKALLFSKPSLEIIKSDHGDTEG